MKRAEYEHLAKEHIRNIERCWMRVEYQQAIDARDGLLKAFRGGQDSALGPVLKSLADSFDKIAKRTKKGLAKK